MASFVVFLISWCSKCIQGVTALACIHLSLTSGAVLLKLILKEVQQDLPWKRRMQMFQNISEMFWIISIPQKDWESRMTFLARLFLKIYFTQYRIIVFIRSWDGKKKIHKSLCSVFIYILVSHFQKQGCKKPLYRVILFLWAWIWFR